MKGLPNLSNWLDTVPASQSVLGNTHFQPMVEELLDRVGIRASLDHVTTSIGHGFREPHPSICLAHLEFIGVDAGDAIFVGDNVERDYFGPRAVGMEAYLIAPRPFDGIAQASAIERPLPLPLSAGFSSERLEKGAVRVGAANIESGTQVRNSSSSVG